MQSFPMKERKIKRGARGEQERRDAKNGEKEDRGSLLVPDDEVKARKEGREGEESASMMLCAMERDEMRRETGWR